MMIQLNPVRTAVFTWWLVLILNVVMAWTPPGYLSVSTYLIFAVVVQSTILCMPVLLLSGLWLRRTRQQKTARLLPSMTYLASLLTILFLLANYKLHDLYGYYINYFVLNLISTPGGIEAMGISQSTIISLVLGVLVLGTVLWILLSRFPFERIHPKFLTGPRLWTGFIALFFIQAAWYAVAEYRHDRSVLYVADRIIWHIPVTAGTFLADIGMTIPAGTADEFEVPASSGALSYPLQGNDQHDIKFPYNIVWLVAESWRADMLTPEFMPNTYAFAHQSQWFQQHYSGGNGTRMGMFTQFYGLYGSYWFDVLDSRQSPLLLDTLQSNDYELMAFTSSKFSYPEFDKTIFSNFSPDQLQSISDGEGWQRDRRNVTDLLRTLDQSDEPFFTFMFFESAHANYYFPEEDIIAPDYLKDFNYITVDIEENIEAIRARYINATHHLDSQLGRVFAALKEQGKMDNTIVIVTGDHGEEFMEKGRWGHNSTFSQEQLRVPLLIYVPGKEPALHQAMTSHLDLPATVLSALGSELAPSSYSYGADMLSPDFKRQYTVASDWHGNVLITPKVKLLFSRKGAANSSTTTTIDDAPINLSETDGLYRDALGRFTRELSRFYH